MSTSTQSKSTPAAFRRRAERVLRAAHADTTLAVAWTRCQRVTWFDGSAGFSGTLTVAAPGYRTRNMTATESHGAISIR